MLSQPNRSTRSVTGLGSQSIDPSQKARRFEREGQLLLALDAKEGDKVIMLSGSAYHLASAMLKTQTLATAPWNSSNYFLVLEALVTAFCTRAALIIKVLQEESAPKIFEKEQRALQQVVLRMLTNKTDILFIEKLFAQKAVVELLEVESILLKAIELKNSQAARAMVPWCSDSVSLLQAILNIQSKYNFAASWTFGLQLNSRAGWLEVDEKADEKDQGYELLRKCLIDTLAKRHAALKPELAEDAKVLVIFENLISSKNPRSLRELSTLFTSVLLSDSLRPHFDKLAAKSLEVCNGIAMQIFAKAGAKNLPSLLCQMQSSYQLYYLSWSWISSDWEKTYTFLVNFLAGNWREVLTDAEWHDENRVYRFNNLGFNTSEKMKLFEALKVMIKKTQRAAVVLLAGIETGQAVLSLDIKQLLELLEYSIVVGNEHTAKKLGESCKVYLLKYINDLVCSDLHGWRSNKALGNVLDSWVNSFVSFPYIGVASKSSKDHLGFETVKNLVLLGLEEYANLQKLWISGKLKAALSVPETLEIFRMALRQQQTRIAGLIIQDQPFMVMLKAVEIMQLEFFPDEKLEDHNIMMFPVVSYVFYQQVIKELFEKTEIPNKFKKEEIQSLTSVLEHFVAEQDPAFQKYYFNKNLIAILNQAEFLNHAITCHNLDAIRLLIAGEEAHKVNTLALLKSLNLGLDLGIESLLGITKEPEEITAIQEGFNCLILELRKPAHQQMNLNINDFPKLVAELMEISLKLMILKDKHMAKQFLKKPIVLSDAAKPELLVKIHRHLEALVNAAFPIALDSLETSRKEILAEMFCYGLSRDNVKLMQACLEESHRHHCKLLFINAEGEASPLVKAIAGRKYAAVRYLLSTACRHYDQDFLVAYETARKIKLSPKVSTRVVTLEFPEDLYEILKEKAATIDKLSLSGSMVEISLGDRSSLLERSI